MKIIVLLLDQDKGLIMKIAISFLKSNLRKEETIRKIESSSADYIHVDLMDGIYAGDNNIDLEYLDNLLWNSKKPLDVHLMVMHPKKLIQDIVYLKPTYVTIHGDIKDDINELITYLKRKGIKVGMALNPSQNYSVIEPYINRLDQILIMSVIPGLGGQKFMLEVLPKIKKLRQIRTLNNYKYIINVDGGINDSTVDYVRDQADMIVSGSYVCMSDNYQKQIERLKK